MLLEKPDRKRGFAKERIIRVLLNFDSGEVTKYRVAKEAETSEAWTREYTSKLEERGLLNDTEVLEPRKLYEEWQRVRIEPNKLDVALQQPEKLLRETELDYATTTYAAENAHQGFLFDSRTDFYVHPDQIEDWLKIVEEKGMIGGGNTRLLATERQVFYEEAPVPHLYTGSVSPLNADPLDEGWAWEDAVVKHIDKVHGGAQW